MNCPKCRSKATLEPVAIVDPTFRIQRGWPKTPLELRFTDGTIALYRCGRCELTFLDPEDEKVISAAVRETVRRDRMKQEATVVMELEMLRNLAKRRPNI